MASRALDVAWCTGQLRTQLVGATLLYYPQLISTMDEALRLAATGEPEGTVIIAETQSAGRGRRGRRWHDQPGHSLLFSTVLRPTVEPRGLPILSLGTAAAVAEVLSSRYDLPVATKWPNDLLIGGRKVGGILLEGRGEAVVVGLGLNVNGQPQALQADVDRPLTTLEAETSAPLRREEVLVGVLEKMDGIYQQFQAGDSDGVVHRYRKFDGLLGRAVCITVGTEQVYGTAEAITDRGALAICTAEGQREIAAGEVQLLAECE